MKSSREAMSLYKFERFFFLKEELWYCICNPGVAEKYVSVVKDTVVRCAVRTAGGWRLRAGRIKVQPWAPCFLLFGPWCLWMKYKIPKCNTLCNSDVSMCVFLVQLYMWRQNLDKYYCYVDTCTHGNISIYAFSRLFYPKRQEED